ncbi:hypothetical protein R3P82_12725 [Dietzia maris]|uniref:Uncharacterized protein n=1 Tax=Dietzia maris TaxID=37915 RepID=A0AAE4QX57_9ACTN|nr:hypothetical protein [Dietzia maris]MDV6299974.1 hypothetical protein [Dietzia maris]
MIAALLSAAAALVMGGVRILRIARTVQAERQALARDRHYINRTFVYQTERVQR